MQHWVQVFRDILDEDNFLPIHVRNALIINQINLFVIHYTCIILC